MPTPPFRCRIYPLFGAAVLLALPPARAEETATGIIAVLSKVSDDYRRSTLPDGQVAPEGYAFGAGGCWSGEIKDETFDPLTFLDVAHVIAGPLARQHYLPAKDPKATRLLILVYWGTSAVPPPASVSIAIPRLQQAQEHLNKYMVQSALDLRKKIVNHQPGSDAAMDEVSSATALLNIENVQREKTDFLNAAMLGYDATGLVGTERGQYVRGTVFQRERQELYDELEENRYFVVLMAYDFELLWKKKQHKLLWETRFSINERHNAFNKALPFMALYASQYFGKASHGLVREHTPEGNVEIQDPSLIEFVPTPKK
jgi:hypothetical protein